ncbi:MAG: hypothetical protein LM581_01490 [Desulfurococcales archaeon]|nr:hypothetical protein [Desulfurococcales archaeon]
MIGIVLDPSSIIPCGRRSHVEEEAVRNLGDKLYTTKCVTIFLSNHILNIYKSKVMPELERCHPLPKFQASLKRIMPILLNIVRRSRGLICKPKLTETGVIFHVLESSRMERYDIDDIIFLDEEDKEFLKVALAGASYSNKMFLVTLDRHFLEQLNVEKLRRRYDEEARKISIVAPNDQRLFDALDLLCRT